ncbi:MAG TPA: T9SS type A sorting domain-containing protein, partial [Bacteroidales bacterium]|nr:T9SS type A sorting domain-containing protein [Bacteroidales bacterium]
ISGPYSWNITAGTQGWQEFALPMPVPLVSGGVYIVSVTTGSDRNFVYTANLTLVTPNDGIEFIRSTNSTIGGTPSNSNANSFFRDVVFVPEGGPELKATDQPEITKSLHDITLDAILYPNPANHLAYIQFKVPTEGEASVEICAINGSLLINSRIKIIDDKIEIDLQELNRGIYLIRIMLNDQIKVFRIVKN